MISLFTLPYRHFCLVPRDFLKTLPLIFGFATWSCAIAVPILVAGSGGGRLQTGRYLHCSDGTPLANLWLTHAQVMGLPTKNFADSTAPLESLLR